MNRNFFISGLVTSVINLMLHVTVYAIFLRNFFASHPAVSVEFSRLLNRSADQLIVWAMIATSLTMGYLITLLMYWSGARSFLEGFKPSFLMSVLFWSSVNFGLYASSNHFSIASMFADLACSAACMTIAGAFAAWMLGRNSQAAEPDIPSEEDIEFLTVKQDANQKVDVITELYD